MKFARSVFARCAYPALAVLLAIPVNDAWSRPVHTIAKSTIRSRQLVDVNHATVDELKTLPGIQDALASKIVTNRPYANKSQLSTKGVLPAATYARIRAFIIAKQ